MTDWILYSFEPKPGQFVEKTKKMLEEQAPSEAVGRGVCPKCGKHIGKGIYMHKKACKGRD